MARAMTLCCPRTIGLALMLTVATGLFAQTTNQAASPMNFPNLATIRSQAAAGSAAAQAKLGDYHMSHGDTTNAFFWYRVAAENGDPQAQLSLAACYFQGRGVAVNMQEAVKWQRMASVQRSNKPVIGRLASQAPRVQRAMAGRIQTIPPIEPALEAASPGSLQKPFAQTLARSEMGRINILPDEVPELEDVQLQPRAAD